MNEIKEIKNFANELRKSVIKMVTAANSGHPGGPLGLADIYAVLYKKILNHKPSDSGLGRKGSFDSFQRSRMCDSLCGYGSFRLFSFRRFDDLSQIGK